MRQALPAALCLALSACGGSGKPSATATPTATATPSPEVAATPTPEALDPLDWRSAEHTGQPVSLVRARSGFLGVETRAVASLTNSGAFRWRSKTARYAARYGFVTLPAG